MIMIESLESRVLMTLDRTVSAGNVPGSPGETVTVPITIDDASLTLGFNVYLTWNANALSTATADISLGALYADAGGWQLVTNVQDGWAALVFYRSSGVPMPEGSGGGVIANVDFHIDAEATFGETQIDVEGAGGGSGLNFIWEDGSVNVTKPWGGEAEPDVAGQVLDDQRSMLLSSSF